MCKVYLFVEDNGHESFITALVRRIARQHRVRVSIEPFSVRGGHPEAIDELAEFIRDLRLGRKNLPDLLIAGIDSNCEGFNHVFGEVSRKTEEYKDFSRCAVPDPHVERWMLIDSHAFKKVFGTGCRAPDDKCDKDRYKELLTEAIQASGINPIMGGMNPDDVRAYVHAMNLEKAKQQHRDIGRFIQDLQQFFGAWHHNH